MTGVLRRARHRCAARWGGCRARPFPCLVRHFARAIGGGGQEAGPGDLDLGPTGLLALLAVPGAFASILMFDKYSSLLNFLRGRAASDVYIASIPDKYFFLLLATVVTGIVTVVKWDAIMPSRGDYMNLAPLPLGPQRIFLANLIALLGLATIFAVDLNIASVFLFPMVVTAEKGTFAEFVRWSATHGLCVLLASAFAFFTSFALIGATMALLPYRLFRTISLYLRLALVLGLVVMLGTTYSPGDVMRIESRPDTPLRWLPPVWFLGLYQSIQGKAGPELAALGAFGVRATGAVFLAAMLFYAAGYRRYFLRIPEVADGMVPPRRIAFPHLKAFLNRTLLRSPFQRACYYFTIRTLVRSETHCLAAGAFLGLAIVIAFPLAIPAPGPATPARSVLAIPLVVAYLGVVGLRIALEIPVSMEANWVFRALPDQGGSESAAVARKVLLTLVVLLIALPTAAAFAWGWGPATGLAQAVFVVAASALLIEVLLLGFRKIPFTCAMPPLQSDAPVRVVLGALGLTLFAAGGSSLAAWALAERWRWMAVAAGWAAAWWVVARLREDIDEGGRELVYRTAPASSGVRLNLLGRG
jgi:hypothetical protein